MITVKQLADELGVSKQAIRKRVNQLPTTYLSTGDNRVTLINPNGAQIIRDQVTTKLSPVADNQVATSDTLVVTLQEQIKAKDKQIEALQKSLNDTTAALVAAQQGAAAAQALHAGTIHQQLSAPADIESEKKQSFFSRIFSKR